MIKLLDLGSMPSAEQRPAESSADFRRQLLLVTLVYRRMLSRCFPIPRQVFAFFVVHAKEDAGVMTYTVCLNYDGNSPLSVAFAAQVQRADLRYWDDAAKREYEWFDRSTDYYRTASSAGESAIPAHYRGAKPPPITVMLGRAVTAGSTT